MSRSRSQRAMSPTSPRPVGPSKSASVSRAKQSDLTSRSEPFLPIPGVSRRQSKGGLRDIFSKNRSTRTLAATSETDGMSANDNTSISAPGNIDVSWVPPPLFQAYPQSVKHINLEASTLSAQSIIRMNEQRSSTLIHDSEQNTAGILGDSASATRPPRRASASVANADWTRKVYVLTTSGRLLQYPGQGAFDRKPEKVLQLGKDSAAFASDAIEGRHFVLHVSQSCTDNGESDLDSSKGIFSRIGIKTASARRSTKILLMVFDTPDDLDSWLCAIRKMIGSLGGRPYSPESFVVRPPPDPQPEISQRYLVRKDPHQFSPEHHPADLTNTDGEERPSTQSSTYTATDLERLRDSKTSNISVVTGTPTSLLDSPPSSPAQEMFALTKAPHLELPDLGPSSLIDFSQHGKRQSRLSLISADITRDKPADVKSARRFSRRESLRARSAVRKNSSVTKVEQCQEQSPETRQEPEHERRPEHEQELSDDLASQKSERPVSTIAPLPASFSLRHTAPELPSNHRYSRLYTKPSEPSTQLPKRYSSLEYSRNLPHSQLLKLASSLPPSPEKNLRRPASMQLRTEPKSRAQTPARSPSLRSLGLERVKSGEATKKPHDDTRSQPKQSQGNVKLPFGPPAGPPPSCPLPAVPTNALPLRRQSLAAREMILSGNLGDEESAGFF
jgi:hypothetical protein